MSKGMEIGVDARTVEFLRVIYYSLDKKIWTIDDSYCLELDLAYDEFGRIYGKHTDDISYMYLELRKVNLNGTRERHFSDHKNAPTVLICSHILDYKGMDLSDKTDEEAMSILVNDVEDKVVKCISRALFLNRKGYADILSESIKLSLGLKIKQVLG